MACGPYYDRERMHTLLALLLSVAAQSVPFTLERLELNLRVDYQQERIAGVVKGEWVTKQVGKTIDRLSREPRLATVPLESFGSRDMTDWS
jgi:hypothetical protein